MSGATLAGETRTVAPARKVRGDLRVSGDKSISHRALLLNAVGVGEAHVTNFSPGADCASTAACLRQMGVEIRQEADQAWVRGAGVRGLREPADVLDCGNSGTTVRLLTGLLAGQDLFAVLSGDGSLRKRPMARVVEPLRSVGARIDGRDGGRLAPLVVQPAGTLRGGEHTLKVASAQVKSALLLAGLNADGPTTLVEPAPTRDHTERMLAAMGARVDRSGPRIALTPDAPLSCVDVEVPGDLSSAAFWIVLGVLHPDAEVVVRDVGVNPTRTGILAILEKMGADVTLQNKRNVAGEPVADVVARGSRLRGAVVEGDLVALAIDEVPLVALLGLFAEGETIVRDAGELRHKESDRIAAVAEGLKALGGDVRPTDDGWEIRPSRLRAGRGDAHGDHRIAMLLALAGTLGGGAEISGAESVAISYPQFWEHLRSTVSE